MFVIVSKSFIFKWKHFWATFIAIWRIFIGHTATLGKGLHRISGYLNKLLTYPSVVGPVMMKK